MINQINEYTDETGERTGNIGIVFKYSFPPPDILEIMSPLVYQKDYDFICLVKGANGCFELYEVQNNETNRDFIEKIKNKINQIFKISESKSNLLKDLGKRYDAVCYKIMNDFYIDEARDLQEKLYDDFMIFLHSSVIERG